MKASFFLLPGVNSGNVGDKPFGRVEADDADRVEGLQAQMDQGLGGGADITVVLGVAPGLPVSVALHFQRRQVAKVSGLLGEPRRHRFRSEAVRFRVPEWDNNERQY